jgi:3'-phosphoadenosine 5'-phosphosulfate (PAPS) 3'-phosphatase
MASIERRVAIDAARAAGHLLKSELPGSRHIGYKGSPTNLVTDMDARAEELIVGRLAAAFPDDAVLCEERGASTGRSGRRWIIDPLDGTTNYAHSLPIFAVSIGLEIGQRVELGVVFDPNLVVGPEPKDAPGRVVQRAGPGHHGRRQLRALRNKLDRAHATRVAPAVTTSKPAAVRKLRS